MTQAGTLTGMTQSNRKLFGTFIILGVLLVYSGLAVAIYDRFLVGMPPLALLAYFVVAGLGWGVPVAFVIRWMAKPDMN